MTNKKLFAGMGDYITIKVLLNWISIGIFASILFFVFTALSWIYNKKTEYYKFYILMDYYSYQYF